MKPSIFRLLVCTLVTICLVAQTGALAQTPPTPRPPMNHKALEQLGWRLGCQAYTFRRVTLFETIDICSGLGIRYLEIYPGQKFSPEHPDARSDHNLSDEMIEKLLAKAKQANVQIVNYGVVKLPPDEAESRRVFEFAKKMKLETIVSEPPQEALDLIEKLVDEYGIKMAIHNHPAPSRYADCQAVLDAVKGRGEKIGACADTGHWYRSGLVPVECLQKLEGHIISMHFKDVNEAKHDVVWGTGEADAKALLVELHRQGAKPLIAIEYESGEGQELIENVAKCMHFLSAVATELAAER